MQKARDFHNAYIDGNSKELDRLWQGAPSTLIKFFPAKYEQNGDNYFLKHLEQRTLWLSSPSEFNDPFDSVLNVDCSAQVENWQLELLNTFVGEKVAQEILESGIGKDKIENLKATFQRDMDDIHKRFEHSIYATCFSEVSNLTSLRMWGHYANNHSGICAEYAFSDVNNATPFGCIPIDYVDLYEYLFIPQSTSEETRNFLKIYTKASEWAYEKEWRVCRINEDFCGKGYNISFAKPQKVFLGCKIDERLKNDVTIMCKINEIELYQMIPIRGSFLLSAMRIK